MDLARKRWILWGLLTLTLLSLCVQPVTALNFKVYSKVSIDQHQYYCLWHDVGMTYSYTKDGQRQTVTENIEIVHEQKEKDLTVSLPKITPRTFSIDRLDLHYSCVERTTQKILHSTTTSTFGGFRNFPIVDDNATLNLFLDINPVKYSRGGEAHYSVN